MSLVSHARSGPRVETNRSSQLCLALYQLMWVSMTLEAPVSRTGPDMLLLFGSLGFTIFLKIEVRDGISPRCQIIQATQSPGTSPKAFESAGTALLRAGRSGLMGRGTTIDVRRTRVPSWSV
jgi:hypothetical protein